LADYDVVFFGENHNSSINHWLQLKITEALYEKKTDSLFWEQKCLKEIISLS
jgi:uncharacterized iron-regulated protein